MAIDTMTDQELEMFRKVKSTPLDQLTDNDLQFRRAMALKATAADEAPTVGDYVKEGVKALTLPIRGYQALGVTEANLLSGKGLGDSLQRGAEATKPEFEAEGKPEKVGAFVGRAVPETVATMGIPGAGAGASKLAKLGYGALRSGAGAAEATVLDQAATTGKVDPYTIPVAAATGTALHLSVVPALQGASRLFKAFGSFLAKPPSASVGEAAANAPAGTTGDTASVAATAMRARKALEEVRANVGQTLGQARESVGLPPKIDLADANAKNPPDLDYQKLVDRVKSAVSRPSKKAASQLRLLDTLKDDIDTVSSYAKMPPGANPKLVPVDEALLRRLRSQVETEIEKLPLPGIKQLRAAEGAYHDVMELHNGLFPKIGTQGGAEEVALQLAKRAGDPGKVRELEAMLTQLERLSEQSLVGPMKGSAAFNIMERSSEAPTDILGRATNSARTAMGTGGRIAALKTGNALSELGQATARNIPKALPQAGSLPSKSLADAINKRRRAKP